MLARSRPNLYEAGILRLSAWLSGIRALNQGRSWLARLVARVPAQRRSPPDWPQAFPMSQIVKWTSGTPSGTAGGRSLCQSEACIGDNAPETILSFRRSQRLTANRPGTPTPRLSCPLGLLHSQIATSGFACSGPVGGDGEVPRRYRHKPQARRQAARRDHPNGPRAPLRCPNRPNVPIDSSHWERRQTSSEWAGPRSER